MPSPQILPQTRPTAQRQAGGSPIAAVRDLRVSFGPRTVVDRLSFDVREGETFGLLGANGSGKTTVLRTLLGMYTPTGGQALIRGERHAPGSRTRVGYLPEERGLYRKEPVIDVMAYIGRLKGLTGQEARRRSMEFLERTGIADKARTRLDRLSGGQQQKVQLGVTMIDDPELLILDEPAKGFDPVNRRILAELIAERQQHGATVILVTHEMPEAERLCDRILLLKDGTARAYGTVPEVQDAFGGWTFDVAHHGRIPPSALYETLSDRSGAARLRPLDGAAPESVLAELIAAGVPVTGFAPRRRSLDDIFVDVYGHTNGTDQQ